MKTYVIFIPVMYSTPNPRKDCENIEGTKFFIGYKPTIPELKKEIVKLIGATTEECEGVEVWELSDFMGGINNEEIDITNYFMSYVYA